VGEEGDGGADENEDCTERKDGSFERDVQLIGYKLPSIFFRLIYLGGVIAAVLQVLSGNSNQPGTRPFNSTETTESSYDWRKALSISRVLRVYHILYKERFRLANIIQTVIKWLKAARQWFSGQEDGRQRLRRYGSTETSTETLRATKKSPPFGFSS
jgi:hypothetical protein